MIQKRFQALLPTATNRSSIKWRRYLLNGLLSAVVFGFFFYVIYQLPYYGDWDLVYYNVGKQPLDPYGVPGFLNPPWMAWILAPFSLFPPHLSGAIWMTLAIILTVWCMHRLEASMLGIILCLLSPPFLRYITSGQIGIVPLLGFVFLLTIDKIPVKGLGILLMSVKPQVFGLGAVTHWLHQKREDKVKTALPFFIILLLSFLIYGVWPLQINPNDLYQTVDMSPWPYGIPIGLLLFGWAIWKNQPLIGGLATFFLVPYVSPSSVFIYLAVLFSKAPKWLIVSTYVFLWAFTLLFT